MKTFFSNFEPGLPSDIQFMNKLQGNLNSIETIRRHTADIHSLNKKAAAIAAVAGFIVGFLFSMSLPYLSGAVSNWQLTLPDDSVLNAFANNFSIIAWFLIGTMAVLISLNSYEISLSLLRHKETDN